MKLITFTVPCYNSQDYMRHCIDNIVAAGEEVEVIIVNDGSKDDTGKIADEYEKKYPTIVKAIQKENGGHGSGVMAGIRNATGMFFKVVDSDDWVETKDILDMLSLIKKHEEEKANIRRLLTSAKTNCEVCYYDVSEIDLSGFPVYASSRMAYARLFLPKLLTNVKYVIYSDVDTLWLDDISDLWNLRDQVKMVCCVREQSEKTKDMEESWFVSNGMEFDRGKYFCTGVSFYNLSAMS